MHSDILRGLHGVSGPDMHEEAWEQASNGVWGDSRWEDKGWGRGADRLGRGKEPGILKNGHRSGSSQVKYLTATEACNLGVTFDSALSPEQHSGHFYI